MTLDQLRYFQAVCQYDGVSYAAQMLNISQPSVSNAIANLEKEFGVILFTRHHKRLFLTKEGQLMREMASQLLSQADNLSRTMRVLGDNGQVLRLGVPPMIGSLVLPILFEKHISRYPQLQVHIVEDDNSGLKQQLLDDRIDMAFLPHTRPFDMEWGSVHLINLENVCFVNQKHPLASRKSICLEELQAEPLVLFKNSFFQTERILDAFSRLSCRPNISLYTAQLSTMQNMILNNNAVGFMFEFLAKTTSGIVGIPLNPPMTTQVSLVWKKSRPVSADMKNMIAFVQLLAVNMKDFL